MAGGAALRVNPGNAAGDWVVQLAGTREFYGRVCRHPLVGGGTAGISGGDGRVCRVPIAGFGPNPRLSQQLDSRSRDSLSGGRGGHLRLAVASQPAAPLVRFGKTSNLKEARSCRPRISQYLVQRLRNHLELF